MARASKEAKPIPKNFGAISAKHTDRVLAAMRKEMESVPKEHRMTVIGGIYLKISKAHFEVKK